MELEDDRPIQVSPEDIEALNGLVYERSRIADTKTDILHSPRTTPPLDAIAKILLSRATGETTACAMQIDKPRNEIILSIASDKSIPKETLDYLQGLFHKLQGVAVAQHKHDLRIRQRDGVFLGYLIRMREQNKLNTLQKRIRNVYHAVYMFTYDNFTQKILEPLDTGHNLFQEFYSATQEVVSTKEYKSRDSLLTIRALLRWIIVNVIVHGKEILKRNRVLSLFLCAMKVMRNTFKLLAGDYDMRCELKYLHEILGFDIYSYIMDIVSISDAIQSLVDSARYVPDRGMFFGGKTLRVNDVRTLERPLNIPSSSAGWTIIVRKMLQALKVPRSRSMRLHYFTRECGDNNDPEIRQRAHPECSIVLHLLLQRIRNGVTETSSHQNYQYYITPLRFIGTSHGACNMCNSLFQNLTRVIGVVFRATVTRKESFTWKFPVALEEAEKEEEGLEGVMLTTREKRCLARMKERIATGMFRSAAGHYLWLSFPEVGWGDALRSRKRKREEGEKEEEEEEEGEKGEGVDHGRCKRSRLGE
ncbi:hypothetical protein RJZ56_005444 [Blastomyces dermatitidis]|uniref:Uncharacterized protein n=3 Tax=Blastomyces TaxID=229219 RepID=A0A179V4C1_BLAGS|nr:uncharacterized protein BDBG_09360 [Blastomyces gilchristii SLH14081]XP_045273227.1 uncharacterized protein BDCG_08753 [Blastomyces dermatitidis ER-3]EQL34986.1 hypothetical protein BDFG_03203 [Blastomyces dermatitidis ATCC 26199]KMW67775.1 hypothetical protein BDDG_12321 [Blastomyces dermatitidis ATCC 18188]EEQ85484.1 hypothetical protein BDCG_08753 [Blastomyces dermatitidis ER-3]OAT14299.1 hypothetical protein BDBG_09360 [Blastomyces gilchristii SLH14081]